MHMPDREIETFAQHLRARMVAQANVVATLTSHPTLIGLGREQALADLLRQFVPKRFEVLSGTVMAGAPAVKSSRQVDVMVADTTEYPTVLRAGELAIVLPESVRAVIEVKSNLRKPARPRLFDVATHAEEPDGDDNNTRGNEQTGGAGPTTVKKKDEPETFLSALVQVGMLAALFDAGSAVFTALLSYRAPKFNKKLREYLVTCLQLREEGRSKIGDNRFDQEALREFVPALSGAQLPSMILADGGAIAVKLEAEGEVRSVYRFYRAKNASPPILSLVEQLTLKIRPTNEEAAKAFRKLVDIFALSVEHDTRCADLDVTDPLP
jgi:hypothetical protein